jgi:putative nucleotidyltransferase with HDIG domain
MRQYQVEKFKRWFADYVAGFYGDDPYVNANIKLKESHSARVCREMEYLAEQVGLDANRRRIAEVISLFHDLGRFEQFTRYRTYNDPKSINHSELGVEILRREKLLDCVEETEKCLIEKAIEYHGIRRIPAGLDGECRLMTKLIRDADKLDIYKIVIQYYRQYRENPDKFKLEVELPDEPGYSKDVAADILKGKRIDYARLRTWNDMKLLQMGWVYDVNFVATLRQIKSRRYLEKLAVFLPQTPEIEKVKETVLAYLDSRIEEAE